jgi:DNA-binding transcriptional MocR family regulator
MLDQHTMIPLYRQLYERLRGSILSGQLQAGTRLPSTRVLASELGVSRTTTALAYEQLRLACTSSPSHILASVRSHATDWCWGSRTLPHKSCGQAYTRWR